jgi:hypothetical protein
MRFQSWRKHAVAVSLDIEENQMLTPNLNSDFKKGVSVQ